MWLNIISLINISASWLAKSGLSNRVPFSYINLIFLPATHSVSLSACLPLPILFAFLTTACLCCLHSPRIAHHLLFHSTSACYSAVSSGISAADFSAFSFHWVISAFLPATGSLDLWVFSGLFVYDSGTSGWVEFCMIHSIHSIHSFHSIIPFHFISLHSFIPFILSSYSFLHSFPLISFHCSFSHFSACLRWVFSGWSLSTLFIHFISSPFLSFHSF